MHEASRELYTSANGDSWHLCRDAASRLTVEHRPNAPSGGRASRVDLATFLARGAAGPEHQALLRLIGSLVDDGDRQDNATRIA